MLNRELLVNTALENIANWLKANKLTLNVKKSNLILLDTRKNPKNNTTVKICIGNNELEQKDSAKYLGVYCDKNFHGTNKLITLIIK